MDSDQIGSMVAEASMEQSVTAAGDAPVNPAQADEVLDDEAVNEEVPPQSFSTRNVQLQLSNGGQEGETETAGTVGGGLRSRFRRFRRLSEEKEEEADEDEAPLVPHIMSEQEIMHKYWKLVVRDGQQNCLVIQFLS